MHSSERQWRVPILMYHQITPAPDPRFRKYAITPGVFGQQMRWVKRSGFVPISLDHLFDGGRVLPRKPIVITFDDGFADCVEHAVPILVSHGFTATFFLVAGLIGQPSRWLVRERGIEYRLMSWQAARRLTELGFECGAHSVTHPRLADLADEACERELRESRSILEDGLGRRVAHLAYPFGSCSESVRRLASQCGYVSGCTVRAAIASNIEDPLALSRVPVNGTDEPLAFTRTIHPPTQVWQKARRAAGHMWHAVVGT